MAPSTLEMVCHSLDKTKLIWKTEHHTTGQWKLTFPNSSQWRYIENPHPFTSCRCISYYWFISRFWKSHIGLPILHDCFEDHRVLPLILHKSTENPPCLADFLLQQKRYWAESTCLRGHFLEELCPQFCLLQLCINQVWAVKCAAIWQLLCSSCTTKSNLANSIYKLKSFGWLLDLKLMAHLEGPLAQCG